MSSSGKICPARAKGGRVLIALEYLPHYRVPFFVHLKSILRRHNIDLILAYSSDTPSNLLAGRLSWAQEIRTLECGSFVYQHIRPLAMRADLVILPQAIRYVSLLYLFFSRHRTRMKLALWGHGRNMQARNSNSLPEKLKRFISARVDWWFAYNELSASIVRNLGFPKERITLVNNTIDTQALIKARGELTLETIANAKAQLGIASTNVAIYTGGLYAEKRIPFLLDAAVRVRSRVPDFHLIIIGNGPLAHLAENAATANDWVHYLGAKDDTEKLPYWAIAKVSLMPGLVGLAILDAFALGTPMIATAYPYHSPEIEYLRNKSNGILVTDWRSIDSYANAVVTLLENDDKRLKLAKRGRRAAEVYTITRMAQNFADGVVKALYR